MSRWRWTLLIFELLLFTVILILPQVELPDFTFHGGTAPVVMKTRLSSKTAPASVVNPVQLAMPIPIVERRIEINDPPSVTDADTRLSLLCTLNC